MRLAVQQDFAARNTSRRIDQPDDRRTGDGFAGTALTDDAEHLARADIEGNAIDGTQRAATRDEFDLEIADRNDRWVSQIA